MKDLVNLYDNKYVRALIQIVPFGIGSATDVYLKETIDKIREDRLSTFFNQLEKGEIELTDDIIESESFLHNYFSTMRIVLNTRRREKIVLIGNLFNTAIKKNIIDVEDDNFESKLKILDDLSFTEIEILQILKKLESKTNPTAKHKNAKLRANQEIWDEFRNIMNTRFRIDNNSLDETLIRIERTGCIYIPRIAANDLRPYCAITTNIFSELIDLITE
jgi:hypothetical protein